MSRARLAVLAGILVSFGTARASAEPPSAAVAEADAHKRAAFQLFRDGNYGPGIREMELAYAIVPHPDLLLNVAIAYEKWPGHCSETLRAVQRFFDACSGCERRSVGEEIFARARATCERTIRISTLPAGAMVHVDGSPVGARSPFDARLAVGAHRAVIVPADGGRAQSVSLFVPARLGREIVVHLAAPTAPTELYLTRPSPEISLVTIDDRHLLPPFREAETLAPGRHELRVIEAGGASIAVELEAIPGQTLVLDLGGPAPEAASAPSLALTRTSTTDRTTVTRSFPDTGARTKSLWGAGSFAFGVGAALAGGALLFAAHEAVSAESIARDQRSPVPVVNELRDQARSDTLLAWSAFGIAAVAVAVGTVLLATDD